MTTMTRTIHIPAVNPAEALNKAVEMAGEALVKGFATLVAWQGRYVDEQRQLDRHPAPAPAAEALRAPAWNG